MILCDRRGASYDLASLFRGRCSTLDRWSGKIAKCIGKGPSALHSTHDVLPEAARRIDFSYFQPSFLDLYGFEAGPPANNRYFAELF